MKREVVMKNDVLSLLLEGIMIAGMVIGAGMLIALPFVLWDLIVLADREVVYSNPDNYQWLLICLYPAILLAIVVLNDVRRILHTVRKESPFCKIVPKCIKRVSICAFVLALVTLIKFVVIPGIITGLLVLAFLLAGLCFWVLGEVFEKAVAMKNENDLTI